MTIFCKWSPIWSPRIRLCFYTTSVTAAATVANINCCWNICFYVLFSFVGCDLVQRRDSLPVVRKHHQYPAGGGSRVASITQITVWILAKYWYTSLHTQGIQLNIQRKYKIHLTCNRARQYTYHPKWCNTQIRMKITIRPELHLHYSTDS